MIKSDSTQANPDSQAKAVSVKKFNLLRIDLTNSLSTLRIVGYGLIALWLLDIIFLLYPLQLLDPVWGFQILGQLVERVGVLLIGYGLISLGGIQQRQKWETPLLKTIVQTALIIAIVYFCFIPLSIGNTVRIARLTNQQIAAEAQAKTLELTQYHSKVANSKEIDEVRQFINRLGDRSDDSSLSLIDLKQQANTLFKTQVEEIKFQGELALAQRKSGLVKRSLKWNIGALLSGIFLLLLWDSNRSVIKARSRK